MNTLLRWLVASFTLLLSVSFTTDLVAAPVGTAFTYQGRLADGATPIETPVDLRFSLFDAPTGGAALSPPITFSNQSYIGGIVQLDLDFGTQYNGDARWLGIELANPAGSSFISLDPRIELKPTPFAVHATTASSLTTGAIFSLDAMDGDPVQALLVDNEGNVGVGLTSPTARLHVRGEATSVTALSEVGFLFDNTSTLLRGTTDIAVSGTTAYAIAPLENGMAIIDVSDPTNPTHINSISFSFPLVGPSAIEVVGTTAYITFTGTSALGIYDVSDPLNVITLGSIRDGIGTNFMQAPVDVFVRGTSAFVVSLGEDTLTIIDISNPALPTEAGFIRDDNQGGTASALDSPTSVYVEGNIAYVTGGNDRGFSIIDISNTSAPVELSAVFDDSIPGGIASRINFPTDIFAVGTTVYLVDGTADTLSIFDISMTLTPSELGFIVDASQGGAASALNLPQGIIVSGGLAYVTSGLSDSVSIFDVSDPTMIREAGFIQDSTEGGAALGLQGATDLFVTNNIAYVASNVDNALSVVAPALILPPPALVVEGEAQKDTGPMWSVFSDVRLKENVRPIDGALDRVLALEPVQFNYNNKWTGTFGRPAPDDLQYGFIAQQYRHVFPQDVRLHNASGYLTVDPSSSLPHLVGAIRELHDALTRERHRNDRLQHRIDQLEDVKK